MYINVHTISQSGPAIQKLNKMSHSIHHLKNSPTKHLKNERKNAMPNTFITKQHCKEVRLWISLANMS